MLDYFALILVFVVPIVIFYGIIVIHDIPYEIAVHRQHPHQDAIHVAGWISLLFLGVIWPFLWIWAMLYKPDVGWGMKANESSGLGNGELESLKSTITTLEQRVNELEQKKSDDKKELG